MNRLNHSVLIVSVAAALLILGSSIALGTRFGLTPGLMTGAGAFTLLISVMLFANRRMNRNREKKNRNGKNRKTTKKLCRNDRSAL